MSVRLSDKGIIAEPKTGVNAPVKKAESENKPTKKK